MIVTSAKGDKRDKNTKTQKDKNTKIQIYRNRKKIQKYTNTQKDKKDPNLTGDNQAESEAGVEEVCGAAQVTGGQGSHCQPQVQPWLRWNIVNKTLKKGS